MTLRGLKLLIMTGCFSANLFSQNPADTIPEAFSLDECITYALSNRPSIRQDLLSKEIGERRININLSYWLPQVSLQYNYSHNFLLQTAAFGENLVTIGRKNNSNILLQADQVIYNNELLLARRGARFTRLQFDQNTENTRINTIIDVSKAFYDMLLTRQQLIILDENIVRQEKQYRDALARYEFGVSDKTDYQRASITLANIGSERKRAEESLRAKSAFLKQTMGFPIDSLLVLSYNLSIMEQEAVADTNQTLNYGNRVEFRRLQVQKQIQELNIRYFRYGFLPSISAFGNYNLLYLNNDLSELYSRSFPTSVAGINLTLPIFQGGRRIQNIRIEKLEYRFLEAEESSLKRIINTEFQTALANYKSNYKDWVTLRENTRTAAEVYEIIQLQYNEGLRAYLDLIIAETDLRQTQLNYYNALYRLLSSKLDLQRALGIIEITGL